VGRDGLRADNANRVPRSELRGQLIAVLIVREGTQVGVFFRFKNKDSHGSVFSAPRRGFGLAVGVVTRLFLRGRNRAIVDCFLASSLPETAHSFAFLASCLFGRLFVKPPSLHFTKEALTLHFLFQDAESLLNIIISHKNLQLNVPLPRSTRDSLDANDISYGLEDL